MNVVERLLIMIAEDTIEKKDLPEQVRGEARIYVPEAANALAIKGFRDSDKKDFKLTKLEANN